MRVSVFVRFSTPTPFRTLRIEQWLANSSNGRMFEDRLRAIQAITDAALSRLDEHDLLAELLERIRAILRADTATVLLLDVSAGELIATAAAGLEEEVRQGVRIPLGRGFAGRIASFFMVYKSYLAAFIAIRSRYFRSNVQQTTENSPCVPPNVCRILRKA